MSTPVFQKPIPFGYLDTDTAMTANSDVKVPSQKAVKAYADTKAPALGADDNYVTDAEKTKLANLSGTNTGDQTLPVKNTGAEIDTGTDDAKFATAKSIADSGLMKYANARFKVGTITRDQTLTTDIVVTGLGFAPKAIIALLMPATTSDALYNCIGFDDGTTKYALINKEDVSNYTPYLWYTGDGGTWGSYGYISVFGSDGFTLATGKEGTPPAGTFRLMYLAFR